MSRPVDHRQGITVPSAQGVPFQVAMGSLFMLPLPHNAADPGGGQAQPGPGTSTTTELLSWLFWRGRSTAGGGGPTAGPASTWRTHGLPCSRNTRRRAFAGALCGLNAWLAGPPREGRHPRRVPRRAPRPTKGRAPTSASPAVAAAARFRARLAGAPSRRRGGTDAPGSSSSAGGPSTIAPRPRPFEAAHLAARPRRVRRRRPLERGSPPDGFPPRPEVDISHVIRPKARDAGALSPRGRLGLCWKGATPCQSNPETRTLCSAGSSVGYGPPSYRPERMGRCMWR